MEDSRNLPIGFNLDSFDKDTEISNLLREKNIKPKRGMYPFLYLYCSEDLLEILPAKINDSCLKIYKLDNKNFSVEYQNFAQYKGSTLKECLKDMYIFLLKEDLIKP